MTVGGLSTSSAPTRCRPGPGRVGTRDEVAGPAPPDLRGGGAGDQLQSADPHRLGDPVGSRATSGVLARYRHRPAGRGRPRLPVPPAVVTARTTVRPHDGPPPAGRVGRRLHRRSGPGVVVRAVRRADPGRHHGGRCHRQGRVDGGVPDRRLRPRGGRASAGGRRCREPADAADQDASPSRPSGPPDQRSGDPRHGPGHRTEHVLRPPARRARLHECPPEQDRGRDHRPHAAQCPQRKRLHAATPAWPSATPMPRRSSTAERHRTSPGSRPG